jgi:hypothetical protein
VNEVSFSFFLDEKSTPKQAQEIDLKRLRIFVPFEVNFIIDEQYAGSFKSIDF